MSNLLSAPMTQNQPVRLDPRRVAVLRSDAHLPVLPSSAFTPQALRARFANPPVWQPEISVEKKFTERPLQAAAVLLAIVLRERPSVLLTQRTEHLSAHSGQIAFPGGKIDATDASASAAALREAFEEVGLLPELVEVLGQLPDYTTGSAFVVTPVVALVPANFVVQSCAEEVADVFEVPLAFLMNPAHHRHHQLVWQGALREWLSMPYQDGAQERFIWGATAAMLRNFYRFLCA